MSDKYRYIVTLKPGVSIGHDRYVEIVEVVNVDPLAAIEKAIAIWRRRDLDESDFDTHIWQADDASIRVERVP